MKKIVMSIVEYDEKNNRKREMAKAISTEKNYPYYFLFSMMQKDLKEIEKDWSKVKWTNVEKTDLDMSEMVVIPINKGEYLQEIRNGELFLYEYLGNLKFKCLTHKQGYHSNFVLIGKLITKDDSLKILAQVKTRGING